MLSYLGGAPGRLVFDDRHCCTEDSFAVHLGLYFDNFPHGECTSLCYWLIERWVVKVVKVMNLQRTSEASCGSSFKGQHPAEVETQVKGKTSLNRAFSK